MKKILFSTLVVLLIAVPILTSAQNLSIQSACNSLVPLDKPVEFNPSDTRGENFELKYTDGPMKFGWGNTTSSGTIYGSGCISFTEVQMLPYSGGNCTLYSVSIGHASASHMTNLNPNTAKIWIKHTLSGPVVYEQPYIPVPGQWVEVTLTTPYTITPGTLVIGYTVELSNLQVGDQCRPLALSETGYTEGGFKYIMDSNPNNYGAGAAFKNGNTGCLGIIAKGVGELAEKDLAAKELTTNLHEFQLAGSEYAYTVTVENIGSQTQDNYTVQIIDETDAILASQNITTPLTSGAKMDINFTIQRYVSGTITLRGKVILDGDELAANDMTIPQTFNFYPMKPIAYCDRTIIKNIHWPNNATTKWYSIRIPQADVAQYVGKYITAIEVGVNDGSLVEHILPWVAIGKCMDEDEGFPLEEEDLTWFDQSYIPINTGWNIIPVNPPLLIVDDDLYLGYEAMADVGFGWGVSRNDNNPYNIEHGHWLTNGGWVNMWEKYPTSAGNHAIIATIANKVCDPVLNLKVEYIDADSVCKAQLTWKPPVAGIETYTIKRDGQVIANDYTGTTFIDETFDVETPHAWTVYYDCDGSPSSLANFQLPKCKKVGITVLEKEEFNIFPNPAKNNISISAKNNFNAIHVINFLGQTVISLSQTGTRATLDISNLNSGVYFVRITTDNGFNLKKFIKQ